MFHIWYFLTTCIFLHQLNTFHSYKFSPTQPDSTQSNPTIQRDQNLLLEIRLGFGWSFPNPNAGWVGLGFYSLDWIRAEPQPNTTGPICTPKCHLVLYVW